MGKTEETERLIFLYSPINRVISSNVASPRKGETKHQEKHSFKMPSSLPLIIGPHVDCAHKPSFSRICKLEGGMLLSPDQPQDLTYIMA